VEFQQRKSKASRIYFSLKRYNTYITTWEAMAINMIKLHMNLFGKNLCILGIYVISDDENDLLEEEFWGKNEVILKKKGNSRGNYICREF
jgi:hypothetical protein